jgi:hypothetical protein
MAINVIDTIKPMSDFPVSEAPDIDVNGKPLDKVVEKIQEQIGSIDRFIELITDEDIDNLE